jgi:uncharacterized protein
VGIRDSLDAELAAAMRRRDTAVVSAVRSALSALANAEAVPIHDHADPLTGTTHVAGAAEGLGAVEAERATRTEEQQRAIVAVEVAELAGHVERLTRLCRRDEADGARRGLTTLTRILDTSA